jgi:integrase
LDRVRSIASHPTYRLHKAYHLAVVTIDGRDFYLGRHGTSESRAEYDRLVAEWLLCGRSDLTVNELILAYLKRGENYYRKDGTPTSELRNIGIAMRHLRSRYGRNLCADFGPLALQAVPGLKKGRTEARESEPVKPVPDASVEAVRPFVSAQVWAMVQLQRLTGMRPGEVCIVRSCDIDTSGRTWVYTPESHKTEHDGKQRRVYLGPQAQLILGSWLKTELRAYLFSPAEAA